MVTSGPRSLIMTDSAASPQSRNGQRLITADGAAVCRRYAVAGALWAVLASLSGVAMSLSLSLGAGLPLAWPILGAGRLHAVYGHVMIFGAVSLPLAGGLLGAAGLAAAGPAARRRASLAFWLWNIGIALGVLAIALGGLGSDAWGILPSPWSTALLWLAALAWSSALWSCALRSCAPRSSVLAGSGRTPVAGWFGLAAAVGLVAYLTVGGLGALGLGGAGQALVLDLAGRGLVSQWAALAGLGVAAAILPAIVGRPLFGRRTVILGLALWVVCGSLAAARDLPPELLPAWLARWVAAANVLWLAAAVSLAAALFGTFIGVDAPHPSSDGDRGPALGATDTVLPFVALGAVIVLAGVVVDAALMPAARLAVQFTAWDPAVSLLPPYAGLQLLAAGTAYMLWRSEGVSLDANRVRWHLWLALGGGLLLVLPLAPLGMVEVASGPSMILGRLGAVLQLPGILLAGMATLIWAWNAWAVTRMGGEGAWRPWVEGVSPTPSPALVLGAAIGAQVLALFMTLFLPLATPAAGAARLAAESAGDRGGGQPAPGQSIYLAEGCAACHTQRVRPIPADEGYGGPTSSRGDASDLAWTGLRRVGPDLARLGDRYGSRDELEARMVVHGPRGWPAFPWLFTNQGPTERGTQLIDYLTELRSVEAESQ